MKEPGDEEVDLLALKDVKIARFKGEKSIPTTTREVFVNVYNAGGQKEYFIVSAIFVKERVTFLLAFDGQDMQMTQVGGQIAPIKYQQTIGTYIDLICHANPCIQLLATKMDSMDGSERDLLEDIWNKVADHLNSFSDKSRQFVLTFEIRNVSARIISKVQIKKNCFKDRCTSSQQGNHQPAKVGDSKPLDSRHLRQQFTHQGEHQSYRTSLNS